MGAPRRFDHEQALARLRSGESVRDLATEYGVTTAAIYRLLPGRAASEQRARERYYSARRVPCEGGCGKLVLGPRVRLAVPRPDGRSLCLQCRQREKRERLRFDADGRLVAVRCGSLDCANGERWQSPDSFPGSNRFRDIRPRGIHNRCRACLTRDRRDYRAAHPEEVQRANRKRMERYYAKKKATA